MPPPVRPSVADRSITFAAEAAGSDVASTVFTMFPSIDAAPLLFATDATSLRRLDGAGATWPFAGAAAGKSDPPSANAVAALDWNHDFRTDLVMASGGGLRLLVQDESGGFSDATLKASAAEPVNDDVFGV